MTDFETALHRLETALDAMVADGIPRETALDAAVMLGLGSQEGVETAKSMRAILQISAPGEKPLRSQILTRMFQGFSILLINRDYPLFEVSQAALAWGHAGAINSVGREVTEQALRFLADGDRAEGMN